MSLPDDIDGYIGLILLQARMIDLNLVNGTLRINLGRP